MKKILLVGLALILVLGCAACNNDSSTGTDDNAGGETVASASDLSLFDSLSALPDYKGGGEVVYPWEDTTSGYWVSGASLDDMKAYGDKLVKAGWVLNDSVADYNPEEILYYTSKDDAQALQLKFMSEEFIRLTLGAPADVEGLE